MPAGETLPLLRAPLVGRSCTAWLVTPGSVRGAERWVVGVCLRSAVHSRRSHCVSCYFSLLLCAASQALCLGRWPLVKFRSLFLLFLLHSERDELIRNVA